MSRQKLGLWLVAGLISTPLAAGDEAPTDRSAAPPSSIEAENVPAVPLDLARAMARYQEIRTAAFLDWGLPESGVHNQVHRAPMIVITRFADTNQVHTVAVPGGARYQVTFHPERVVGALARPGHAQLVFEADEGGAENFQLYLVSQKGGETVRLTDGKSRNMGPSWTRSGKRLAYSSNARNQKDMDLYVVDPDQPDQARRFKDVAGSWSIQDWSPDESRVVAIDYRSILESYVHVVEVGTGNSEQLTPAAAPGGATVGYEQAKWSRDGRSIFWVTDAGSEFRQLVRYDLATRASTVLSAGIPWDVEEYALADDGQTLALVANEDGVSRLHVLDARTGREAPAPQLPAGVIGNIRFQPASRQVGFTLASARSPADAYAFDLDTWSLTRWTTSETAGFDTSTFAEPALIHFASFDDRKIPAFVYRPDPAKFPGKRPVIMSIHGGPESQFRPRFLGRANWLLNELGVTLVYPNVRGSSGYGKSYLALDNGLKRRDSVQDIGSLLDWIATQPDLDASRVGVTGGSYGGFMSLAVQTTYNTRIRAGIDIVGISNFVTFLQNTQEYRRDLRRAEYGDERNSEMRAFLEEVSPLRHASEIKTPILVVQGQNDPRVPLSEAQQMVAAVRENKTPVWYVVGKNEGHGFAKKPNQDYLQAVEALFWKSYLLDQER